MAYWLKYGNYSLTKNGVAVGEADHPVDPYNPLGLPPYTIRCKFSSGYTPTMGDSQTLVDAVENVWDITKASTNWASLFQSSSIGGQYLLEVVGANSTGVVYLNQTFADQVNLTSVSLFDTSSVTGMVYLFFSCARLTTVPAFDTSAVTSMQGMFDACTSLTSVPLFNTSQVRNMSAMFYGCTSLISVPLFNTGGVTDMGGMFNGCTSLTSVPLFNTASASNTLRMFMKCTAVQSGSLALYQQASTQTTPPGDHREMFTYCGSQTVTGAQELAQIPTSWGGTMQ